MSGTSEAVERARSLGFDMDLLEIMMSYSPELAEYMLEGALAWRETDEECE